MNDQDSMDEYLEVDVFVCGVYRGKKKVHKDSMVGRLATGNYTDAMKGASHLMRDIAAITDDDRNDA